MTPETAVAEAIMNGKMDEARQRLKNGEPLSGHYVENNKSQIIGRIFRDKAFDLIDKLVENGVIQTDIYEYDTFDRSIFKNISMNLQSDPDSLAWLIDFMTTKIQNKNEEVKDRTALQFCMEEGADPQVIQCLIEAGCDVQYKNNAEMNLIYIVVNKPMLDEKKALAYIELLLSHGVDVNSRNVVGTTPLMVAVQQRKTTHLPLLLLNGSDPNEQDNKGNSAFYYAVVQQQSKTLYDKLKEYAAPNFDSPNKDDENILTGYLRMANGASAETLSLLLAMLEDGADLYQTSPYYSKPKSGIDWLAEKTPEMVKAVLATGKIGIDRQDDQGNTILHKICGYNVNYDQDTARRLYQKVKLLLEAGADPTITNNEEETPLMLASKDNLKAKTVDLLLQQQHKN